MEWNWSLAGSVVLSGLVIVFIVLIILIGVVNLTGRLTGAMSKPAPKPAPVPAMPAVSPIAPPVSAPAVEQGIGGETVAVISAAVAAMMDEQAPGTAYAVTGIQHARTNRPVWGFAGMQQNTRPF